MFSKPHQIISATAGAKFPISSPIRGICVIRTLSVVALMLLTPPAAAHVVAYEKDSCTPHGVLFDTNVHCPAGVFTQCKCRYVPGAGSTTPDVDFDNLPECPGAGATNPTTPPGAYYYRRLTTCGLGFAPPWDSSTQTVIAIDPTDPTDLGWTQSPSVGYSPPFGPEAGKPSCGHVALSILSTGVNDPPNHPTLFPEPFDGDWTHDCELPGTALVTKTQAMDGDLKVAQGATVLAGFDFTMPGSHPAAMIGFLGAKVVFIATCASGTPNSEPIVVNIPNQAWQGPTAIPANNSAWYPSGDQNSADTFQGSETVPPPATVPSFCDPDTLVRLQKGGTFSTNVLSDDKQDKINVRWHYKVKDGTGGGWSGTYSVIGN